MKKLITLLFFLVTLSVSAQIIPTFNGFILTPQADPPAAPRTNQIYLDSDDGLFYQYNGSSWVVITSVSQTGSGTSLTTTNFDNNLSGADGTVQAAMETLDDLTVSSTAATTTFDNSSSWIVGTDIKAALEELDDAAFPITQTAYDLLTPQEQTERNWLIVNSGSTTIDASSISLDVTNFDGNLSGTDTDVQTALETLDELAGGGGTDDQTAAEVSFLNTTSGLTATDVQAAIDEVEARVDVNDAKTSGISDVVSDTSPQLGGNLTLGGNTIQGSGEINYNGYFENDNTITTAASNYVGNYAKLNLQNNSNLALDFWALRGQLIKSTEFDVDNIASINGRTVISSDNRPTDTASGITATVEYQGSDASVQTGSLYGIRGQALSTGGGYYNHLMGLKINATTLSGGSTANSVWGIYVSENAGTGSANNASIHIAGIGANNALSFAGISNDAGSAHKIYSVDANDLNIDATNVEFSGTINGNTVGEEVIQIACSDLTTDVTTGTNKAYFRMPYAATLTDVRVSLLTAGTTTGLTVDINEGGTSVLSTKLTTDATEKTSTTAATAAVISDSTLADDAEITIDFDAVPTGGQGVIVTLKLVKS